MQRSKLIDLIANSNFNCWVKASEAELATARPSAKAKAKVKASAKTKCVDGKHERSPVKAGQPSPNPQVPKRIKGKQSESDQTKMIEELKKAGFESICVT